MASPSASQPQALPQPQQEQANGTPPSVNATLPGNNPALPATSVNDTGSGPRPRDARTIHLILSQLGVSAYQERVPLQLLDFAYRYTAGILGDAQHLAAEGYNQPSGGSSNTKGGNSDEVGLAAVRMAAAARQVNQFTGGKETKEQLLERAAEINKVRLPRVEQQGPRFGVRLPHERFLLTGKSWDLNAQWELEDADDGEEDTQIHTNAIAPNGDAEMGEDNEDDKEALQDFVGGNDDDATMEDG
ncbi:MAG: hypothetical protein Q9162_004539 [Coniocarpon cinnabarinum]